MSKELETLLLSIALRFSRPEYYCIGKFVIHEKIQHDLLPTIQKCQYELLETCINPLVEYLKNK